MLAAEFPDASARGVASAPEALAEVASSHWDIAIVDLNMPGRGGLDLIRLLKDASPSTAVLVYSVHPAEQFGVRSLRAGADGYVSKDTPASVLLDAVRRLRQGRRYITPELAERLADQLTRSSAAKPHDLLSDREMQILQLLAAGSTPSEIAAGLNLSIKTVSTYRARILQKLDLSSSAGIIRYAIRHKLAGEP